jgi:SET domain-containing protein
MKRKYLPGQYALSVKRSSAGLGLFAAKDIPKGTCVIEYVGRVISKEEEYTSRSRYLFEVNKNKTLDGTTRGNTARYINHSCRPNCETTIYKGRVFIFTTRKIRKGEELAYDYGKEYFNEYFKKTGCKCASCMKKH